MDINDTLIYALKNNDAETIKSILDSRKFERAYLHRLDEDTLIDIVRGLDIRMLTRSLLSGGFYLKIINAAILAGRSDIVRYIGDQGWEIFHDRGFHYENRDDHTVPNAIETGDIDILEYLVTLKGYYLTDEVLDQAIRTGNSVIVLIVTKGIQKYRDNALLKAVRSGNAEIVEVLLLDSANPNIEQGTALIEAYEAGNQNILDLLIKFGGDTRYLLEFIGSCK